jgi:hypothetical protein
MVSDDKGRPLTFFLSPGQMSDAKGALVLLAALPRAKRLLGDKGYRASVRHRSKGAGEGRLAAGRTESPKRPCLHSGPQRTEPPCQLQPQTPQEALPDRECLCSPQGSVEQFARGGELPLTLVGFMQHGSSRACRGL